jgi:hypothetical protein
VSAGALIMHLKHEFYKFAFRFDVERLRAEVEAFPEECWLRHPQNYKGNSALPLVSTEGEPNDKFQPPMRPTKYLEQSPYIQQVLSQFQTLLGRSRLMRLEPGDGVPPHFDVHYYWRNHTRVHIPIITHPDVQFCCENKSIHMTAGEAWTFDNWRKHHVINNTPVRRVHLTFDTYGCSAFWALAKPWPNEEKPVFIPYKEGATPRLAFESYVGDPVMSPSEVDRELSRLITDIEVDAKNDPAMVARVQALADEVNSEWRLIWYIHGPSPLGVQLFKQCLERVAPDVEAISPEVKMASNGMPVVEALMSTMSAMVKSPATQVIAN